MNLNTLVKKQFPKAQILRMGLMGDFDLDLRDGTAPDSWMVKDNKIVPVDFGYLIDKTFGAGTFDKLKKK